MFKTKFYVGILAVSVMTAILIATVSGEEAVTTPDTLKVGMIAPDFTLKDEEGTERSLSDYLGSASW